MLLRQNWPVPSGPHRNPTFRVLPDNGRNGIALGRAVEDDGFPIDPVLVAGLDHKPGGHCGKGAEGDIRIPAIYWQFIG